MQKGMVIRKAIKSDSYKIIDLFSQLGFESSEEKLRNFFEKNTSTPISMLYLAEKDNSILGVIDFSVVDYFYYQKPILCIRAIVVDKTSRGQGIGNKLMEFAQEQAIKNNCRYIELVSGVQRKDAHRFYLNAGFSNDTHLYFRKHI